jgi:lipopolysaccharide heptosyltransferase I
MPPADDQSFLVVRLGSLGDLMHTLPAVAALRCSFPRARLDWVVEEKWCPLVELVTIVDGVIPWRRSVRGWWTGLQGLRRRHYDCAVDFQGLYKSALLARFSGAPRRIGFHSGYAREPGAARFYNQTVSPTGRHVAEMNMSLAVAAGAKPPGVTQCPLRLPAEEVPTLRAILARAGISDFIVVSPGGGWRSKCWPPERYGALCAEMWRRLGVRAVVNAGPGEEALAEAVVAAAAPATPLVLSPSLRQLAALLGLVRVVVAADTGPLHLAAALGTPVVALFGPTDPGRNGPLPKGTVLRNASEKDTTYRRSGSYSPSMLALSVGEVAAAVERELSVQP